MDEGAFSTFLKKCEEDSEALLGQAAPNGSYRRNKSHRYAELNKIDASMTGNPNLKNCQNVMG